MKRALFFFHYSFPGEIFMRKICILDFIVVLLYFFMSKITSQIVVKVM